MAFVQTKFGIALREYIAKKIYSLAAWDGNKGPVCQQEGFRYRTSSWVPMLTRTSSLLWQFSNKGFFEGNVCIAMDRVTEAELKATPKIAGAAGGFVIENGLCAGYPYVVSHFVNTELNNRSWYQLPTATSRLATGSGSPSSSTATFVCLSTQPARLLPRRTSQP